MERPTLGQEDSTLVLGLAPLAGRLTVSLSHLTRSVNLVAACLIFLKSTRLLGAEWSIAMSSTCWCVATAWSSAAFLSWALEQDVDVEHPANMPLAGRRARLILFPHRMRRGAIWHWRAMASTGSGNATSCTA